MHDLTRLSTTAVDRLSRADAVIVQPIGAVEQHGPHLPIITDALMAEEVTKRAIDRLSADSNVWSLPTLHYGKSTEHLGRAGTISLSTSTLIAVCLDVGRSVARSGFRKLVFVNGHGGQPGLLETVARDIRFETGLQVFTVMPHRFGMPPGSEGMLDEAYGIHGGQLETSVMLALAPELVFLESAVDEGHHLERLFDPSGTLHLEGTTTTAWLTEDVSQSGVLGKASAATVKIGTLCVRNQVEKLADFLMRVKAFSFASDFADERSGVSQ